MLIFSLRKSNFLRRNGNIRLDNGSGLTDNRIMAKIERPSRRAEALEGAKRKGGGDWGGRACCLRREAPRSAKEGAKGSPHSKLKNYLLHYQKGKYYFIDLSLKKKGHQQI